MTDELTAYYSRMLTGTYDCVDRIVLNAYFPMGHSPGGFREWWRRVFGSDDNLDNEHLMRMAGRFARRLRAYAKEHSIEVLDCENAERKHQVAEAYLQNNPQARGLFLIQVSRFPAITWNVARGSNGITNIAKKKSLAYVNHYSFHILDPDWGHLTIKMSGHPPFAAQILLNGHEYVAAQARKKGIAFGKEGNCFTQVEASADLALVADTLRCEDAAGRLSQVINRWIYSACLCFALDLTQQEQSNFVYEYSLYQIEYSRNLLFARGAQMEQVFEGLIDRSRTALDIPQIKTIFGRKHRPQQRKSRSSQAPRLEAVVETPVYNLTVFKLHFGSLTLKGYTKGEHVLRFEAVVHNVRDLQCGRRLDRFAEVVDRLGGMLSRFLDTLCCIDTAFVPSDFLDTLPLPSQVGATRVGGIDTNKARTRAVLSAVSALSACPQGFLASDLATKVQSLEDPACTDYGPRQAAYDLKKLRGKCLVEKIGKSRRYAPSSAGLRSLTALVVLRERVLKPLLSGVSKVREGQPPRYQSEIDQQYETLCKDMTTLFSTLGIAA